MESNVAGAAGKGALSGAGTGLAIGSNPLLMGATGGLSAPIGAALGAIAGGTFAGSKQNKSNKAQQIPMVDPIEQERLSNLEQQRKSLMAGTDAITQNNIDQINKGTSSVQNAITKNTGGDVSATLNGFLSAQKSAQNNINNAVSQGSQRLPYFDSASGNLLSRIAQRRLELQRLRRDQLVAENAQSRTDNNVNANALLGTQGGVMSISDLAKLMDERKRLEGSLTSSVPLSSPVIGGVQNLTPDYASPIQSVLPTVPNQIPIVNIQ